MKTVLRRGGPALIALFALLVITPATFAHATLEESDPAEGGTIATPYVMVARFDEELSIELSSLVVRDSAGTVVAEGGVQEDSFTMAAELPALPPGNYVAHWIAITPEDNGKTQGDINFTVVAASPSPAPTPPPATATLGPTAPPSATPVTSASPSLAPTAAPSPPPTTDGSATGSELILPILLAFAVAAALAFFLLRRRPT